jgi:hypothetical protein
MTLRISDKRLIERTDANQPNTAVCIKQVSCGTPVVYDGAIKYTSSGN